MSKPLILAGHGVRASGAVDLFRQRANEWGIPVVLTQFGKDALWYDHPLFIGTVGVRGDRAGNLAVMNAERIIVIGASLHEQTVGYERERFAPQAVICKSEQDIGTFLLATDRHSYGKSSAEWLAQCQQWKVQHHSRNEPHMIGGPFDPLNDYELCYLLSDAIPDGATVVTDSSSTWYVFGQAFRVKERQRYLSSGSLGCMGWAMPAMTGAAMAEPGRLIVGITGDGSFMMSVNELAVWRQHGLNVKLFVVANNGYACIKETQRKYCDGRLVATDRQSGVPIPHGLWRIAMAFDIPCVEAYHPRERASVWIAKTLAEAGPCVCIVPGQADQQLMPAVESKRMDDGTMASGRLDEMWP